MRIGPNTPDLQAVSNPTPTVSSPVSKTLSQPSENGEVSLSNTVSLTTLATQALQTPEVRQDRVDSLRQSIASGQYRIDANASADGMLQETA